MFSITGLEFHTPGRIQHLEYSLKKEKTTNNCCEIHQEEMQYQKPDSQQPTTNEPKPLDVRKKV